MSQSRREGYDRGRGRGGRGRGEAQRGPVSYSTRPGRPASGAASSDAPLIYNGGQPAKIDARIASADQLIPRLKGLGLAPEHPRRPGYGTKGQAIVVRANFFAMELTRDTYYEYTVDITPVSQSPKPSAYIKRRVLAIFEESPEARPYLNKIVHDGARRLIAAERLPQPLRGDVKFFDNEDVEPRQDADSYTVSVEFSGELPTAPLKRYLQQLLT